MIRLNCLLCKKEFWILEEACVKSYCKNCYEQDLWIDETEGYYKEPEKKIKVNSRPD